MGERGFEGGGRGGKVSEDSGRRGKGGEEAGRFSRREQKGRKKGENVTNPLGTIIWFNAADSSLLAAMNQAPELASVLFLWCVDHRHREVRGQR